MTSGEGFGILEQVMQARYELTIVFPEKAEELKKKVLEMVEKFAAETKGKVVKQESWGVKELAYPIQRRQRGLYEHFVVELEPQKQPELAEKLRLQEGILRYLFVRV